MNEKGEKNIQEWCDWCYVGVKQSWWLFNGEQE